jgi:hypothetical protein
VRVDVNSPRFGPASLDPATIVLITARSAGAFEEIMETFFLVEEKRAMRAQILHDLLPAAGSNG